MKVNNNKVINAWSMYDWANSVYSLVITSTIFPVYYNSVTAAGGDETVQFFGLEIVNTVLYSYSLSFSFLLIAVLSPLLSGVADYTGRKRRFMKIFAWLGAISCMGLYFFEGNNIEFGIICSVFASIGYSGSLVFYNAFLPEIATPDRYDSVSARGYALGYVGSVLLMIFNLVMISSPEWFGIREAGAAARISFLLVGIWWIGFAQISFYFLPSNVFNRKPQDDIFKKGYREIKKVWLSLKKYGVIRQFLCAFFFYSIGVQTVMYLAATFGDKALQLPGNKLILTILIIQVVAIGGAYLFAYLSRIRGNKLSLTVMVVIWSFICLFAYFVQNEYQFYALAFVVGLVMGGIQSLSRSTYTKLIPKNTIDHASYFSFYDVTEKLAIVVGTFSYGFIEQITGSMRNSTIALTLFFIIGLAFLRSVKVPANVKPDLAPTIA